MLHTGCLQALFSQVKHCSKPSEPLLLVYLGFSNPRVLPPQKCYNSINNCYYGQIRCYNQNCSNTFLGENHCSKNFYNCSNFGQIFFSFCEIRRKSFAIIFFWQQNFFLKFEKQTKNTWSGKRSCTLGKFLYKDIVLSNMRFRLQAQKY